MARRKTPRLAYCEYVLPGASGNAVSWKARLLMMDAVKAVYPVMLQDLSARVFPAFASLAKSGFKFDSIHSCIYSKHRKLVDRPPACRQLYLLTDGCRVTLNIG